MAEFVVFYAGALISLETVIDWLERLGELLFLYVLRCRHLSRRCALRSLLAMQDKRFNHWMTCAP